VRAETLVVPAPPAMSEKNPPWVTGWLRDPLLPLVEVRPMTRRLYVTRGPSANNRTVVNEEQVLALLRSHGFEAVDPGQLSVVEQIEAFAAASVIVAPHGAALANIAFCSAGATVVELFPRGSLLPDFWRMACAVPGLRYRYVSAFGGPRKQTRQHAIVRDIDVDLDALEQMISD
jgi:capsular polysaccharide biosynthesis protein